MKDKNSYVSKSNSSSNSSSSFNSEYDIIKLINKDDWNNIFKLLKKGIFTPRTIVNEGNTITHIAFNQGISLVIDYVSKNYPELLKQLDSNGQSCLHILIKNSKYDIFLNCLENINDKSLINVPNHNMRTPIMYLAKHANNNEVYKLLKKIVYRFKQIDYYVSDIDNKSVVHEFIKQYLLLFEQRKNRLADKLFNLFEYILNNIDINYEYKLPLLTYVINETNNEDIGIIIIKLLLTHKADPNINTKSSFVAIEYASSPLQASIKKNYNKISTLLLDYHADPNYQGSYGSQDSMFQAIRKNNDVMICKLLDYGYNCKLYDKNLNTAAHLVLIQDPPLKYSTIFEVLGNKNTNLQQKNINNDTVIDILQAKYDINIFKRVLDYKLKRIFDYELIDIKNTDTIIKFPNYNNVHTKSFITTPLYNILYTFVILLKYNTICIPFQFDNLALKKDSINRLSFDFNNHDNILFDIVNNYTNILYSYLPHLILWKGPDEYFIHPDLKIHMLKCMNKHNKARFIMMKISLLVSNTNTHANVLIIDKQTGNVDRFDPYGYITLLDTASLDKILEHKLTKIFKPFFKVNYLRTKAGYNLVSFQTISNDDSVAVKRGYDPFGYCLAWCFWYVELRINNPNVQPHFLIKQCIKRIVSNNSFAKTNYNSSEEITETNLENTKNFNNYIRSYAANLDNEKNKLLEMFGINKDNAYDIVFNSTQHNKIINQINNTFNTKIIPLTFN